MFLATHRLCRGQYEARKRRKFASTELMANWTFSYLYHEPFLSFGSLLVYLVFCWLKTVKAAREISEVLCLCQVWWVVRTRSGPYAPWESHFFINRNVSVVWIARVSIKASNGKLLENCCLLNYIYMIELIILYIYDMCYMYNYCWVYLNNINLCAGANSTGEKYS